MDEHRHRHDRARRPRRHGADQAFITGASRIQGVAVDGAHVYWANFDTGAIGRANLDGTGVDQSFITGASNPEGVAVDALGAPTIADLIASVEALDLHHGLENSLLKKLTNAQRNLDADDTGGACDKLASFISQVKAQSGKKIDADDAADLIEDAQAVEESVGCG